MAILAMMGIIGAATLVAYGVRKLVVCPPATDNAQTVERIITLPDNTTIVLPDDFSLKKFMCIADNTLCFPNDNTSLYRRQRRGGIELWRI